jgi:membrane protease subunit HflK
MAWNEPGGGNNKDPWGGRNQGPPDLDEALKKLQEKLNSIFSGGGSGGSSSKGGGSTGGLLTIIVIVLAIFWAGSGIYQVDEKEQSVILRLGKYHDTTGPGLHWYPPLIDDKYVVNVTEERQYQSRGLMLTEDENIVELPLTVQYNISDAKAFVINVRAPEISLQQATESALRQVVGHSTLDDVVSTGRSQLGSDVKVRLQRYMNNYGTGINVVNINIQEAQPPTQVKAAYDDVIKAREDQERLVNEAQAYSNGIIPEARGAAQRVIEEASGYQTKVIVEAEGEANRFEKLLTEYSKAPEVTRERLYIDAVEAVMSNSSKVLIDVEGGNNMMYLPLDQLTKSRPSNIGGRGSLSSSDMDEIADTVIEKLRREQNTSRRREAR